ncbi:hypothetical protein F5Y09DRAFT_353155 [Xylaria sp. FL1042]|nr:hypothetical protein F5Y09DRAFT_353155 [Xylaria sp. FL1042]
MSEAQKTTTQSAPEEVAECVFSPVKDNPEEAEKFIRAIVKCKPYDVDLVSAELAPLYGFGPHSNCDVLARSRAQAVLVSPVLSEPFQEFTFHFICDSWDLPVAKFPPTLALVHKYKNTTAWNGPDYPVPMGGSPEEHYARFLIRILNELEQPIGLGRYMLKWLCDTKTGREDAWVEDVCWVYFHALMYLQLNVMQAHKCGAPLGDRARHYINEHFKPISKLISARKSLRDVSQEKL